MKSSARMHKVLYGFVTTEERDMLKRLLMGFSVGTRHPRFIILGPSQYPSETFRQSFSSGDILMLKKRKRDRVKNSPENNKVDAEDKIKPQMVRYH